MGTPLATLCAEFFCRSLEESCYYFHSDQLEHNAKEFSSLPVMVEDVTDKVGLNLKNKKFKAVDPQTAHGNN